MKWKKLMRGLIKFLFWTFRGCIALMAPEMR